MGRRRLYGYQYKASVAVDRDLLDRFHAEVERRGETVSEVFRRTMRDYVGGTSRGEVEAFKRRFGMGGHAIRR